VAFLCEKARPLVKVEKKSEIVNFLVFGLFPQNMLIKRITFDFFVYFCAMKKEIIQIIIKVAIYALSLIAACLGVSFCTSCSTSHSVSSSGVSRIVTIDTTYVKHGGFVRSKNYLPYE
jgi:hypothetical protein